MDNKVYKLGISQATMVYKPAYFEVNQHAIDPNDINKGLDLSGVCGWIREKKGDVKYSGLTCKTSPTITYSPNTSPVLLLDAFAEDKRAIKNIAGWTEYWRNSSNGRIMASMGDFYADFKVLKEMVEHGSRSEQYLAQKYLDDLDADLNSKGLFCDSRLFYSSGFEIHVVHHFGCTIPSLIKVIKTVAPVYTGMDIANITRLSYGDTFLQALFNTLDRPSQIIQTLEFITDHSSKEICCWTAEINGRFPRANYPERTTWLGKHSDVFALSCEGSPSVENFTARARGVRIK